MMAAPQTGEPTSDEKLMSIFAYVGLIVIAIPTLIIFLTKKDESAFIKKHCLHAFALFVVAVVIDIVLGIVGMIPVIGLITLIAFPLVGIAMLLLTVWMAVKASQGVEPSLPIVTDYLEQNFMK